MSNESNPDYPPPQETAAFEPLMARAESHWREYRPKIVAKLEKEGRLQQALTDAVTQAILAMQQCLDRGMSQDQAEEVGLPMILLPPEAPIRPERPSETESRCRC